MQVADQAPLVATSGAESYQLIGDQMFKCEVGPNGKADCSPLGPVKDIEPTLDSIPALETAAKAMHGAASAGANVPAPAAALLSAVASDQAKKDELKESIKKATVATVRKAAIAAVTAAIAQRKAAATGASLAAKVVAALGATAVGVPMPVKAAASGSAASDTAKGQSHGMALNIGGTATLPLLELLSGR